MSTSSKAHDKHPSTYFMQQQFGKDALARLSILDQKITGGMGGVLSEQADPNVFQHVLDVSCGSGGWLIEVARTYPGIAKLVGIDASEALITHAQTEAKELSERVEFRVMDALRFLEFPDATFDLINLRMADTYLRTWDWPNLLSEFKRISQPGGVIRLTEADLTVHSNSSALTQLSSILVQALYQSGHAFTPDDHGVNGKLAFLLQQCGAQNIQERTHLLKFEASTQDQEIIYEDMKFVFRATIPFLRKWTRLPDDYETLYQQALDEMQRPDFVATWRFLTVWGSVPHP